MRRASSLLILATLLASGVVEARPIPIQQVGLAAGDTTISPPARHAKGDPFEKLNRRLFNSQQGIDRSFFRPVAIAYTKIFPKFLRAGLRHLLSHIKEPIVFLNDLLQLKPKHAARTLARFVINTTAGIGGLLDVAKTAHLPHRDNGLGNTLARYGVGPGPYLFLPFIGPTDLRDILGGQVDGLIYPIAIGQPFNRFDYIIATTAIQGLDRRVENDDQLKALLDGAADPYATLRSVYLQNRLAEIAAIKDQTVQPGLDDALVDPEAAPGSPPAPPNDAQAPPTIDAPPTADAPSMAQPEPSATPAAPTPDATKSATPAPSDPATAPLSAAAATVVSGSPQLAVAF